jgi:Icc-related predicted phosphoesterase
MARIWVLSDLHLEAYSLEPHDIPEIPAADVFVVAGDVASRPRSAVRWLSRHVGRHMPVIYVMGNHELWGDRTDWALLGGLRAARGRPVHLLEDEVRVVAGVRFLGCTLWTDYSLYAPAAGRERDESIGWGMRWANGTSADARHGLRAEVLRRRHQRSRTFLEGEMSMPFDGPTVVVTHHAPHPNSVSAPFAGAVSSETYASDLTSVIEAGRPDLWIHGHMHASVDYVVGDTRIVANPRGFGRENPDFDPGFVVEVG